jgi:hypothetical protein
MVFQTRALDREPATNHRYRSSSYELPQTALDRLPRNAQLTYLPKAWSSKDKIEEIKLGTISYQLSHSSIISMIKWRWDEYAACHEWRNIHKTLCEGQEKMANYMLIFTHYKPYFPWHGTRLEKMANREALCSRSLRDVSDYATSRTVRPSNPINKRYYNSSKLSDRLWGPYSLLFNVHQSISRE